MKQNHHQYGNASDTIETFVVGECAHQRRDIVADTTATQNGRILWRSIGGQRAVFGIYFPVDRFEMLIA
jgi:hypothetical protein